MFLRLCLRFAAYFIVSAIALQALFLLLTLIAPGSTKIGYEIAAAFPAAYLLGRAEPRAPALLSALVIATFTMLLFSAQMWLTIKLAGIDAGFDRYPAASFAILAAIFWAVGLGLGFVLFRAGQKSGATASP